MRFETLFLHYIGITTFVYPYLIIVFNYFSYTYLYFGILLVVFFLGSIVGTLVTITQGTLHRWGGVIAILCGFVLLAYPFATHHALLIVLQFLFGVCNGILRIIDREVIQSNQGGSVDQRKIIRRQFAFMVCATAGGGLVGYLFDITAVIILSGLLLICAGVIYSVTVHKDYVVA